MDLDLASIPVSESVLGSSFSFDDTGDESFGQSDFSTSPATGLQETVLSPPQPIGASPGAYPAPLMASVEKVSLSAKMPPLEQGGLGVSYPDALNLSTSVSMLPTPKGKAYVSISPGPKGKAHKQPVIPEPEQQPNDEVLSAAVCENCSSGESSHLIVLCDGCSRGFHTFCLVPRLSSPPKASDWFCPTCHGRAPLDRKHAIAAAKRWYDTESIFSTQHKLKLKPLAAYRNNERAWSVRYKTVPDTKTAYFVRVNYYCAREKGVWTWRATGITEEEASEEPDAPNAAKPALPAAVQQGNAPAYIVEQVLNMRRASNGYRYLVKWLVNKNSIQYCVPLSPSLSRARARAFCIIPDLPHHQSSSLSSSSSSQNYPATANSWEPESSFGDARLWQTFNEALEEVQRQLSVRYGMAVEEKQVLELSATTSQTVKRTYRRDFLMRTYRYRIGFI